MFIIEIRIHNMNYEIYIDIEGFLKYFNKGTPNKDFSNTFYDLLFEKYQEYNIIEIVNDTEKYGIPNFSYDAKIYSQESPLITYNENNKLNHFNANGLLTILNNAKNSTYTKVARDTSNITIRLKDKIANDVFGGNTKIKKEILGKQRCIYKKAGDRKEYVKYKGDLITVKDYKKIISVKKIKK